MRVDLFLHFSFIICNGSLSSQGEKVSLLNNLKEARSKERAATCIVLKYLSQVQKTKLHLRIGMF